MISMNHVVRGRRPARAAGAALVTAALLAAGATSQADAATTSRPPSTTDTMTSTGDTGPTDPVSPATASRASTYERVMLSDRPTMMLSGADASGRVQDAVSPRRDVAVHGRYRPTRAPDGRTGMDLDGRSGYLSVAGSKDLSIAATGRLTVELLVRPDRLRNMTSTASSGDGPMVHLLQKGDRYEASGDQEYAFRFYDARAERPNRLSAYAFNPAGGLGAGSYFQDRVRPHGWIHVTAVYDTRTTGPDGWGTVRIYRDGALRDVDSLGGSYRIRPVDGGGRLFIGGNPDHSFFDGAVGAVAVYPTALSPGRVAAHAAAALGR